MSVLNMSAQFRAVLDLLRSRVPVAQGNELAVDINA
jgi:hypothetical protein